MCVCDGFATTTRGRARPGTAQGVIELKEGDTFDWAPIDPSEPESRYAFVLRTTGRNWVV